MEARSNWLEFREQHGATFGLYVNIEKLLERKESAFQTIEIYETDQFGKMLVLDGFINTTEKDEFIYHEMLSHVPLYSHPCPESVLIIGGGDGGAMREILRHPSIRHVDLVDLDEDVIEISKRHFPQMAISFSDPRAHVHIEDGAEFIKNTEMKYDVVIVDSTDPVGPGEVLFSHEFYENIHRHFNPNGVLAIQGGPGSNNMNNYEGIYQRLQQIFSIVKPYVATIDTYGGLWTLGYASQSVDPIENFRLDDYEKDKFDFFYYNEAIHKSCFALPSYHRKRLFDK